MIETTKEGSGCCGSGSTPDLPLAYSMTETMGDGSGMKSKPETVSGKSLYLGCRLIRQTLSGNI
jgi:hypothetical protein